MRCWTAVSRKVCIDNSDQGRSDKISWKSSLSSFRIFYNFLLGRRVSSCIYAELSARLQPFVQEPSTISWKGDLQRRVRRQRPLVPLIFLHLHAPFDGLHSSNNGGQVASYQITKLPGRHKQFKRLIILTLLLLLCVPSKCGYWLNLQVWFSFGP